MTTFNPYLNFKGNSEEAFNFYKSVFGGEFAAVMRFKDTPEAERVPAHEREKIMHIALPIGKGNVLMATDALESMGHTIQQGNNFHISIDADSEAEADNLFSALSVGGKVAVPMNKMFWGSYFGMFTDKFGVQWMVSCHNPK
ncbi:MAG TPA: VOC family protein [Cyclobacteriaceae bacterium]|nr:VOC family protein [Cyclobacteriaceae bacterium]